MNAGGSGLPGTTQREYTAGVAFNFQYCSRRREQVLMSLQSHRTLGVLAASNTGEWSIFQAIAILFSELANQKAVNIEKTCCGNNMKLLLYFG